MSAVMLGNIGQLPKTNQPTEGANYRALTSTLLEMRRELPRMWPVVSESSRADLYKLALNATTSRPSVLKVLGVLPGAIVSYTRLHRAGQFGDFLDYARTLELVWDDILSLSENDHPQFKQDSNAAIEDLFSTEPVPVLRNRADIDDFFRSL